MIIYDERTHKKYDLSMEEYVDGEWIDAEDAIIDSSFHWDYERDCWRADSNGEYLEVYLDDWIHYATDFDDMFPWEREEMQASRPRYYSLDVIG